MSKLFNTVVIIRSKNGEFKEPCSTRIFVRAAILATGKDTISDDLKNDFVITKTMPKHILASITGTIKRQLKHTYLCISNNFILLEQQCYTP